MSIDQNYTLSVVTGQKISAHNLITKSDYYSNQAPLASDSAELKDDSLLLYALMDAGVEDWPGFGEAMAIYRDRKEKNDY